MRRLMQDPQRILKHFVAEGMVVLEPGCGMGFFTLDLARMVGPGGRVVAVDLQPRMLASLQKRARKAGVADRIEARVAGSNSMNVDDLSGRVDFGLAFAVIHELPEESRFFVEMYRALRPGGKVLVSEPKGHVTDLKFRATMKAATAAGFRETDGPLISGSRTAVLEKSAEKQG